MNTQTLDRAAQITRSATEVLGLHGAAGLTHRAVDRHAGLPEGSTSNLFRTRLALIEAVCRFLTEHDLAMIEAAAARFSAAGAYGADSTAEGLADLIEHWTGPDRVLTAARLELFLIAHREPHIAAIMVPVRRAFAQRTRDWLDALSPGAGEHAGQLQALVEGLTSNQLLHTEGRMDRVQLRSAIRRAIEPLIAA